VVLEPGEVVDSWTKMLGSFVAHDKLDTEDSLIQRLYWLIVVNS
jgi:hypothetical protein